MSADSSVQRSDGRPSPEPDHEPVPHPDTNPEMTRRFIHPTHPSLFSPAEAILYNNVAYIAQQNRHTHTLLENILQRDLRGSKRRARSASVSSAETTSEAGNEQNESPDFDAQAIFNAHKDLLLAAFKTWAEVRKKPVRKIRGNSGKTEEDAGEFLGDHVSKHEGEKPEELIATLAELKDEHRDFDRTELFLTVSRAYSVGNPEAVGTKGTKGNGKKRKPSTSSTSGAGPRKRSNRGASDNDDDEEEGGDTEALEDVDTAGSSTTPRRRESVTIATPEGARHPGSSF